MEGCALVDRAWIGSRRDCCRGCLPGPLFRNVHDDLVEEIAGVEGGFAGGLDEADDALGVGRDE